MKQITALKRLAFAYAKTGKKHRAAYRMLTDCIQGEHDTIFPAKWHRGPHNLFELRDYTNGCFELLRVARIDFIYDTAGYRARNSHLISGCKCSNRIILTNICYY